MYTPTENEKTTPVMIYTQNTLIRGDVVTRQSARVSVWLRTEGAPEFLHLLKPQVIFLNSTPPHAVNYAELYFPLNQVIAFHMTPPAKDPPDYEESEKNRVMHPITIQVGTFLFNGALRVSTQVDIGTSIASNTRVAWLSLYEVKVSNPALPQIGEMPVSMLLVRPAQVGFALTS